MQAILGEKETKKCCILMFELATSRFVCAQRTRRSPITAPVNKIGGEECRLVASNLAPGPVRTAIGPTAKSCLGILITQGGLRDSQVMLYPNLVSIYTFYVRMYPLEPNKKRKLT